MEKFFGIPGNSWLLACSRPSLPRRPNACTPSTYALYHTSPLCPFSLPIDQCKERFVYMLKTHKVGTQPLFFRRQTKFNCNEGGWLLCNRPVRRKKKTEKGKCGRNFQSVFTRCMNLRAVQRFCFVKVYDLAQLGIFQKVHPL